MCCLTQFLSEGLNWSISSVDVASLARQTDELFPSSFSTLAAFLLLVGCCLELRGSWQRFSCVFVFIAEAGVSAKREDSLKKKKKMSLNSLKAVMS